MRTETVLPFHKCTDEDFAQFYPIAPLQQQRFSSLKEEEGLYCIDWDDENPYLIYGIEDDPEYARLDVKLAPCNEIDSDKYIDPACNFDPEKQFDYLSSSVDLIVLFNN